MLRVISEGYFNESRYAFLRNSHGHKVRRKALNLYLVKICFEDLRKVYCLAGSFEARWSPKGGHNV